jgi:hypothetical protein
MTLVLGGAGVTSSILQGSDLSDWRWLTATCLTLLGGLTAWVVHAGLRSHGDASHAEGFVAGQLSTVTRTMKGDNR